MTWPPVPQPPCDPGCSCYEPDPAPPYTPIPRTSTCTSSCCAPPEATARWIEANSPGPLPPAPESAYPPDATELPAQLAVTPWWRRILRSRT
jgi:hypothetical protein